MSRYWAVLGVCGVLTVAAGCPSQGPTSRKHVAQQVWPTKERPIVLNRLDPGGGLIFGGPDGKLRNHLVNWNAHARYAISWNKQVAACVSLDWPRTKARWVTFFDRLGKVMANVMLPPPPATKEAMRPYRLEICLSNGAEAIVTITRRQQKYYRYKGLLPRGVKLEFPVERYYVLPSGAVKRIEAAKDEQFRYVFPDSGGIVMLRTEGQPHLDRPWQIERYDKGLKLRWRKVVTASFLHYMKPRHDFSVYKRDADGREFMHFRRDGSFEVEAPPPDRKRQPPSAR